MKITQDNGHRTDKGHNEDKKETSRKQKEQKHQHQHQQKKTRSGRDFMSSSPNTYYAAGRNVGGGLAGSYQANPLGAAALYGSFGGYGHGGGGCKGKDDDNLLELVALGVALAALVQALMAGSGGRRRRRRRRSSEAELKLGEVEFKRGTVLYQY